VKVLLSIFLILAGGVTYYLFVYRPAHAMGDMAYALGNSVQVVDSPSEVHRLLGTLKSGERVQVLAHTRSWVHVRAAAGKTGWVEAKSLLLDAQAYETGQQLLKQLEQLPPQAAAHAANLVNLHIEPSREAPIIAQLPAKQKLEIFGRRLELTPQVGNGPSGASGAVPIATPAAREAWYLVRADSQAGWVVGRLVELDIPEGITTYADGTNLVAWLVLSAVLDENRRQVPQYVIADRVGAQESDFNHLRVLTWSKRHQRYATAYVEGSLNGYFPIRVTYDNGIPYFRVRLMGAGGRKIQKVYGLFDTITRPLGIVEGWESNAVPMQQVFDRAPRHRLARRRNPS
jgi:hypothetical protein